MNKFRLSSFQEISEHKEDFSTGMLQCMPCGLHRADLSEAGTLLPEFNSLFKSVPVKNHNDWEVDIKIHMLMKGQYPCIPNWHCDNVPRDENGNLLYQDIAGADDKMLIWLSGEPLTEFLSYENFINKCPSNHGELSEIIDKNNLETRKIPEMTWCRFSQVSPHRGIANNDKTRWRVFVRVTHKTILPQRPVLSRVRRHAQVYLPSNFHW